jgi:hypothetical protein
MQRLGVLAGARLVLIGKGCPCSSDPFRLSLAVIAWLLRVTVHCDICHMAKWVIGGHGTAGHEAWWMADSAQRA